jgi:hypothetical protein
VPSPRSSSGRSSPAGAHKASRKTKSSGPRTPAAAERGGGTDGVAGVAEQLVNVVLSPLDAVVITRERMQEVLEEAAERGRLTRSDANDLVAELFKRGRQQTDELLDRIMRGADRARRTVGVGPAFPIRGYDDLTAGQVEQRLAGLKPADLRWVRDYERRHANRKTVLAAVEKALA